MIISIVAALAENRTIGVSGKLPWHISEDLKYFKSITLGLPIIMGRKTFDSIGSPLSGRQNIIISRNPNFSCEGIKVAPNLDAALVISKKLPADETMIIGGGQIYNQALPIANRLYLTEIHAHFKGDTVFPEFNRSNWTEKSRISNKNSDGMRYSFVVLERE